MWYGDSHLMGHHFVPKHFYATLKNRSDLSRYNGPIHGKTEGGRSMDKDLLRDIFKGSEKHQDKPALFIVEAGSNNLRESKDVEKTKEELIEHFKNAQGIFL